MKPNPTTRITIESFRSYGKLRGFVYRLNRYMIDDLDLERDYFKFITRENKDGSYKLKIEFLASFPFYHVSPIIDQIDQWKILYKDELKITITRKYRMEEWVE